MPKRIYTIDEIEYMIDSYSKHMPIHAIAKNLKTNKANVSKILKDNNIKIRSGRYVRQYFIDEFYFRDINTEHKAYWLGFLLADGNIHLKGNQKLLQIDLKYEDKYILAELLKDMNSNYPIRDRKIITKYGESHQAFLRITSSQLFDDLLNLNMKNKNEMPNIPNNLYNHFIRGYFDGDGCFSVYKRGDAEFYILAELKVLESFAEIFNDNNININNIKHKKEKMFIIRKSGRHNIKKIYDFLYSNATIFLKRKHDKMGDYLNEK